MKEKEWQLIVLHLVYAAVVVANSIPVVEKATAIEPMQDTFIEYGTKICNSNTMAPYLCTRPLHKEIAQGFAQGLANLVRTRPALGAQGFFFSES